MAIFQDIRRLLLCSTLRHITWFLGVGYEEKFELWGIKFLFCVRLQKLSLFLESSSSAMVVLHMKRKYQYFAHIQSLVILTVSVWSENESELPLLQHHIETDVFPQNRNPSATAPYINRCETVGDFGHWCGSYFFAFDILSRSPKIVSIKWSTVYLTKL